MNGLDFLNNLITVNEFIHEGPKAIIVNINRKAYTVAFTSS